MELLIARIIEHLILPPGGMLLMMVLGIVVRQRFYRSGQFLVFSGFALLLLLSLPVVSGFLIRTTENIPALDIQQIKSSSARAIVILGGGRYSSAPEYQADTVSKYTLERLRYGAYLHRQNRLPILVTGGKVYGGEQQPEAALMKQVLEKDFVVPVRWAEGKSRTTFENAVNTQTILASEQINHILLVTHALHMPRAREAFEQAGFSVTPAPMSFHTPSNRPLVLKLLPGTKALRESSLMLHEWLGRLWYRIRYY